ncbi:response regulator transcription factor [Bradyrhizobium sp.]|uniref:response regulator transcription factor n=1 Tax=Bradyrhizobium sp. TaxID=376 RepID=UPI0039E2FF83
MSIYRKFRPAQAREMGRPNREELVGTQSQETWHTPAFAEDFREDVFARQRTLRTRLLDGGAIRLPHARDLAAHMLLHLDDLSGCWSIATNWLRAELRCQRVDTGFGMREASDYFPGFAEAKDADYDVPSFGGKAVDNRDAAMQAMWLDPRPVIFADIKQDSRITMKLRQRLSGARTKSKFAWALRTGRGSYGLICADWTEHFAPWESGLYDCFEQTVVDVLSPIVAVAKEIADRDPTGRNGEANAWLAILTASEIEVARLVAKGMSYKEIARVRRRSFSTIDHQLRSIRQKTGASSTSALVSLLARTDLPLV